MELDDDALGALQGGIFHRATKEMVPACSLAIYRAVCPQEDRATSADILKWAMSYYGKDGVRHE